MIHRQAQTVESMNRPRRRGGIVRSAVAAGAILVGGACSADALVSNAPPTMPPGTIAEPLPNNPDGPDYNIEVKVPEGKTLLDLLPPQYIDSDNRIRDMLLGLKADSSFSQSWRGAAMHEIVLSDDESMYLRLDNPVELKVNGTVYWAGYDRKNDIIIKVPVGHVGSEGERVYDEQYQDVTPTAYADNEQSGQLVAAHIQKVDEEGITWGDYYAEIAKKQDPSRKDRITLEARAQMFSSRNDVNADSENEMGETMYYGVDDETDKAMLRDFRIYQANKE